MPLESLTFEDTEVLTGQSADEVIVEQGGTEVLVERAVDEVLIEQGVDEVVVEQGVDEVVSEVIVESEVLEFAGQGPAGPPGSSPKSPAFTYAAGRLVGVVYADGSTKTMTWAGEQLAQVDFARVGYPTTRKTLAYNLNGTLASVIETVI